MSFATTAVACVRIPALPLIAHHIDVRTPLDGGGALFDKPRTVHLVGADEGRDGAGGSRIVFANALALRAGIRPGQPLAFAYAQGGRSLSSAPFDTERLRAAQDTIMARLLCLSADVRRGGHKRFWAAPRAQHHPRHAAPSYDTWCAVTRDVLKGSTPVQVGVGADREAAEAAARATHIVPPQPVRSAPPLPAAAPTRSVGTVVDPNRPNGVLPWRTLPRPAPIQHGRVRFADGASRAVVSMSHLREVQHMEWQRLHTAPVARRRPDDRYFAGRAELHGPLFLMLRGRCSIHGDDEWEAVAVAG